ncbi:SDR family NAD(P)-dependent oxidoreductase [Brachybacterium sp. AOP25-B2-12]|uniref:SDR family NAD(P)-dependent oxidoreductase n=1 Tax=Brachybacterium sp. AOP25-B2-12 TaxID=3457710 RepID=UPI004034CB9A
MNTEPTMNADRGTTSEKTWIITGASSGLGRALAEAALDAGERVVATARRPERLESLVALHGERLLIVAHDVRDTDTAPALVERAMDAFGGVDVLVNNAGVGQVGTAEEVSDGQLRDMLAQHLLGPAALVRAVLPSMRAAGHGAIVQMSSQGGRTSFAGVGSYSAGKFALEGWSEALAAEIAPFGIRTLIVEPSRFRTGFNSGDVLLRARRSAVYDDVAGAVRTDMDRADGVQEGDPVRAARVIRQVLALDDAPLRLPLGAESVRRLSAVYSRELANVECWAELSASADYPGVAPSVRPV